MRIRWTNQLCGLTVALTTVAAIAAPPEGIETTRARYDDQVVVRVNVETAQDLRFMLQVSPDPWSHRVGIGGPVDFRVSSEHLADMAAAGLEFDVIIEDLQGLIDAESARLANRDDDNVIAGTFFDEYKTYTEISDYIDTLVALRPDLAERVELGTSLRGRAISGIRITNGTPGDRPAVLIHGCQHAREWITVMVNTYIADAFIRNYDTDAEIRALLDETEWIIVPIVNPDGYEYTWTDERLWRKNRRSWYGVDLNRNWGYKWGGEGSSGFRFSETYRGSAPFSEPETQALRDFFEANPHIGGHVDIHSYSQLILQPWGYTAALPPAHELIDQIGSQMAADIFAVHGRVYVNGPSYTTIYPASGVAPDWTYGDQGVLAYTYELRDTGQFGFILPPDQIIPNAEEVLPAMITLGTEVARVRDPLTLSVSTLTAGQPASMTSGDAMADARVYFVYSVTGPGSVYAPLLGTDLGLANPALAGVALSDGSGSAVYNFTVPGGTSGTTVWLQAAQYGTTSPVEQATIN